MQRNERALFRISYMEPRTLLRIINKLKAKIKEAKAFQDMCDDYDMPIDFIDLVPMKFGELPVSARTEHGIITLNVDLLKSSLDDMAAYGIHEIQHYIDQCYGEKPTLGADDGDYLSNPSEQKGFQRQVQFLDDQFGQQEAENYTDHLLDHHDKSGKEREKLKDKLMERVLDDE